MGHTQFNAGGFNVVADRCVSVELKQKQKKTKKYKNENQHVDMGKQSTNIKIFGYKLWNCS